jgi:integral membrane sensor domain MASE1
MIALITTKRIVAANLLLAAVYVVSGTLGLTLAFVQPNTTALWPPAGIAVAALLLFGSAVAPAVLLGAFVVNYSTTDTAGVALAIALGNTLEAALGAYLTNRFANGAAAFNRANDVMTFALIALVSTVVGATVGASSLWLAGSVGRTFLGQTWLTWWLGDLAAVLVLAPALILWSRPLTALGSIRRAFELGVWLVLLVLIAEGIFGGAHPLGANHYPLEFLSIPLLIWAAFRFGRRATATGIVVLSAIALVGTLEGTGPFARESTNESLLLLQAFMATIAITVLALAAAVRQNAYLLSESRRHLWEIQASRRLLTEREDALRKSVAETLHGRVQTRLLIAWQSLGEAVARLGPARPDIHTYLNTARQQIDQVREEDVRQVSHLLHPSVIAAGLVPAIRSLASSFDENFRITFDFDRRLVDADDLTRGLLPERVRLAAYRVAEEALNNICAHASASEVTIAAALVPPGTLHLRIRDNGRGFRSERVTPGLGLRAIGSRVDELEGSWNISSAPGEGTTLSASLPAHESEKLRQTQPA